MRQIRLRLRSPIVFILTILMFLFCLTLYASISSTNELERQELTRDQAIIPPGVVPFWSAINHPNIYDLHATPSNSIFFRQSNITQRRIDELYQLIRNARNEGNELADKEKLFPLDPQWDFQKLVAQQEAANEQEEKNKANPEPHIDTPDSAGKQATKTTTITTAHSTSTTAVKTLSDYDRKQLRHYIHQVIAVWKKKHENDKVITLADLMLDDLQKEESS